MRELAIKVEYNQLTQLLLSLRSLLAFDFNDHLFEAFKGLNL